MASTYGWNDAVLIPLAQTVLEALGEQPDTWHVTRRAATGLPLEIWYVGRTGLVRATANESNSAIDAVLTPWSEVKGVSFGAARSAEVRVVFPSLSLRIASPELTLSSTTAEEWGDRDSAVAFIEAIRDLVRAGAINSPRSAH